MRILFFLVFFILSFSAKASPSTAWQVEQDTSKRSSLIGLPIVFFSPETNWAFGGAGIYTFRFPKEKTASRPSQLQLGFAYTLNKQLLIYMPYELYWDAEKYKLYGEIGYYRYSYFFYGIGREQVDTEGELYGVEFPRLRLNALYQVRPNLYTGIRYLMDNYTITDIVAEGILDSNDIFGKNGGLTSGIGAVANYDTRDNIFFPTKGMLIEGAILQNGDYTGSDYTYTKISIDAAKYIGWNNQVFALNWYTELTFGDVPFNQMALLGGNKKMRGYYEGRYRDNHVTIWQAEYRFPLFWRLGGAAFAGYGGVSDTLANYKWNSFKYTIGAGLRILLSKKDKINLRIDTAYGQGGDGMEFYVTVGEAF